MSKAKLFQIIIFSFFVNSLIAQKDILPEKQFTENFFGRTLSDPYRYMENPKDTLVQQWFKYNSYKTRSILNGISGRKEIVDKLIEIENRKSFNVTLLNVTDDDYYFYLKATDKDKTAKLYFKNGEDGSEVLLYDPSNYKMGQKDEYVINYLKPSWDHKIVALGLSKNGEEIGEIAFLNVAAKSILPEVIPNTWPAELKGINWLSNNSGIIYQHIPIIDSNEKNYLLNTESVIYKLGDNPLQHKIIFSKNNNPEFDVKQEDFPLLCKFSQNDKYILVFLAGASNYYDCYYAKAEDLKSNKIDWKLLFKKEDQIKDQILINEDLYCLSAKNASNFNIFKTNVLDFNLEKKTVIVSENKKETIDDFVITKDGLFYSTTKNGVEAHLYFVSRCETKEIVSPLSAGTITMQIKNKFSSEIWLNYSGWINPKQRYRYDTANNRFIDAPLSPVIAYPEYADFVVKEIEIPSQDGVMVPVSLIYKKGLQKNKLNNVLIEGYGAYGTSLTPIFEPIYLSWVLNDGVYVVSHVRGGGEKGDNWHQGGYKSSKSNSWEDLIATAEYLIKEKITSKERIAISSGSAGGILVGRAITERPDLFKVMLCENGTLNTTRIKEISNGQNNMKEFGNPDIAEEFNALYEMDSYQHLKKGVAYPACLISVGINDARVPPAISGKFVARLKASTTSQNPILFAVNYDTGHGMDSSDLQLYNDYADGFAFALWQMGHPKFKFLGSYN
ncbi:prolyl oligopeptidase family serine peptidase [Flavobacterium humidisoli]|uniref:prolyl oligopeptidase n=1 Tax=Flavobacterium humidisoli TaxID=2937442 RepID=A0ABY4LY73_9FLAO|nr:prolyl oligopeptidase family serine peptidase [Flavobacterium humidisoli]UPZ18000.1 prolyl oligopeptidase family serine peptidase [Flavobacterium humidisoli]